MAEILHQLIGSLSHCLQGFIHPRWCRISPINSWRKNKCNKLHCSDWDNRTLRKRTANALLEVLDPGGWDRMRCIPVSNYKLKNLEIKLKNQISMDMFSNFSKNTQLCPPSTFLLLVELFVSSLTNMSGWILAAPGVLRNAFRDLEVSKKSIFKVGVDRIVHIYRDIYIYKYHYIHILGRSFFVL